MNTLEMTLLIWAGSCLAGFVGALTGLGGGIVIVPLLTLAFHFDIRYAIGASLVSVIATSSGAAAAYVKEGYANMRLGILLEIATTAGAVGGAAAAAYLASDTVAVTFGLVLLFSAYFSGRRRRPKPEASQPDRLATLLRLDADYPANGHRAAYHVRGVPGGFGVMFIAGAISGLLGIGSGALKVLAMDQIMRIPFKVSTTTSNFMIGVTAAASAGVYLNRGYVAPGLAMPVVLGVLPGALLGTRLLPKAETRWLRILFAMVLVFLAVEMIYNGLSGSVGEP
ncbi:MAG: sulfite exporter TauE/SafE family protein [Thermoguttaceae bacterium]